ncbi:hypothetical protein Tco_0552038 [Tanacetum coccineum]
MGERCSKDVLETGITVLANIANFRYNSQYLLKHSWCIFIYSGIYMASHGKPHHAHAREEIIKSTMKCCSFQKKDLEKHYDRMSQRFYCLNGVDDVNLEQVFLNSFPESLGNEAYRALEA